MKQIKIITILLSLMVLVSCEKWLDVNPKTTMKGDEMFQSQNGFNDVLIGVYTLMANSTMYGDNLTYGYLDVLAQYYSGVKDSPEHFFANTILYDYQEKAEEARIGEIWRLHYKAIINLNSMMLYFEKNRSLFSEGVYEVLKGETIALRALLHFNLVRLFGQPPAVGMDVASIPYMDEYTNIANSPLKLTAALDKIIEELTVAANLMKEHDPYGVNYKSLEEKPLSSILSDREFRMNYYATVGTLAAVNLYAGNKGEALRFAKEIIEPLEQGEEVPYQLATIINSPVARSEFLFGISVSKLKDYTDPYFGAYAMTHSTAKVLSINSALVNNLYATESPSSIDMRPSMFFSETTAGKKQVAKYNNETVIPMLKLSEIYLIAAESDNNLQSAINYFNSYVAHRGIVPIESTTSAEELKAQIYKEYKREFIGEGKLFFYYKRLNYSKIGINEEVTIVDPVAIYTLPIPNAEYEFGNM